MPVYIEKVEIWSGVTIVGRTNDQEGKIELLSHWTMEGWDEQKAWLAVTYEVQYSSEEALAYVYLYQKKVNSTD